MPLVQLGLEHTDIIAALLETSWRSQFRSGSYPVFSRRYLDWLYAGPHAADNVLLGYEQDGRLAGFRALLFRRLSIQGTATRAHISTHLTVHPDLTDAQRTDAVTALGEVHSYVHPAAAVDVRADNLLDTFVSFFDEASEARRYQQATERRFSAAGVARAKIRFQPAIVKTQRLRDCLVRHGAELPAIATASPSDAQTLTDLFHAHGRACGATVTASPPWVGHHLFALDDSRVYVSHHGGAIDGCLACYALDTVAGGTTRRVVIIEYLLAPNAAAAAALLAGAVDFAEEQRAKGVVLENSTSLDGELCSEVGLMPSARRMVAAIACRSVPVGALTGLLLDVK